MSFLAFIFLLFIFCFVVWPLLRGALFVRNARSRMRRQMEDLQRETERQQRANRPGGWETPAHHQKKYAKTDGEYVPFQEINVQMHEETTTVNVDDSTVTVESQITDAEWEEIK